LHPNGTEVLYHYAENDTVDSFRTLLQFEQLDLAVSIDLFCHGVEACGRLRDLPVNEIHAQVIFRRFSISLNDKMIFYDLPITTSLTQARKSIAKDISGPIHWIQLSLSGAPLDDNQRAT
jgi:hypothetical protein